MAGRLCAVPKTYAGDVTAAPALAVKTPLGLLLDDKVNLKANNAITGIDMRQDALVVHARTSNNRQQGNITLVFSNPQIELRQWTIKDNQGGTTMVALHAPQTGVALDDSLFAVPLKTPRKNP